MATEKQMLKVLYKKHLMERKAKKDLQFLVGIIFPVLGCFAIYSAVPDFSQLCKVSIAIIIIFITCYMMDESKRD